MLTAPLTPGFIHISKSDPMPAGVMSQCSGAILWGGRYNTAAQLRRPPGHPTQAPEFPSQWKLTQSEHLQQRHH